MGILWMEWWWIDDSFCRFCVRNLKSPTVTFNATMITSNPTVNRISFEICQVHQRWRFEETVHVWRNRASFWIMTTIIKIVPIAVLFLLSFLIFRKIDHKFERLHKNSNRECFGLSFLSKIHAKWAPLVTWVAAKQVTFLSRTTSSLGFTGIMTLKFLNSRVPPNNDTWCNFSFFFFFNSKIN